jgi:hypothetical protein
VNVELKLSGVHSSAEDLRDDGDVKTSPQLDAESSETDSEMSERASDSESEDASTDDQALWNSRSDIGVDTALRDGGVVRPQGSVSTGKDAEKSSVGKKNDVDGSISTSRSG